MELLKGNELEKFVLINFYLFRNKMFFLVEIWNLNKDISFGEKKCFFNYFL